MTEATFPDREPRVRPGTRSPRPAGRGPSLARRLAPAAITALMISSLATGGVASAATTTTAASAPTGQQPVTIHADPKAARASVGSSGTVAAVRGPAVDFREVAKDLHLTTEPRTAPRVAPHDSRANAPSFTANYPGPSGLDPSAATNGSETLATAGNTIAGFDSGGNQVCAAIPVRHLVGADGSGDNVIETPQIQYDSSGRRFIMLAPVATGGPVPIVYVAVSASNDPCGTWFSYRLTLTGDSDAFTILPSLGQDPNSVLVSLTEQTFDGSSAHYTSAAFAVPKTQLYSDSALPSFPLFHLGGVHGLMAATNAGNPMASSPADYFITATPGSPTGSYDLYRMSTSGPAAFTLQAHFTTAAFQAPDNPDLPFTDASLTLDNGLPGGDIQTSAVYDGTRVWFAHTVKVPNGPATTLRYGFIDTGSNTLQFAQARHDSTSADFNPSIGVSSFINGVETVWLNWAIIDPANSIPVSPTVATMLYNGGSLPVLQAADTTTVVGGTPAVNQISSTRSAVSPDPTSQFGTCALTAQQYFSDGNQSLTQVTRVCGPSTVRIPNVAGSTPAQAQAALHSAFLNAISTVTTTSCSAAQNNLVVSTTPAIGQLTPIGSNITLQVCNLDATVPTLRGLDDTSAQNRIRAAGFTVGQVTTVSDCGVFAGDVSKQDPPAFTTHTLGTPINIQEASGLDTHHKPCVDK